MTAPVFDPFDFTRDAWPPLADDALHLWLLPHQRGERSTDALRAGIAGYLDIDPCNVDLHRSENGRPVLASPASALQFSASHSGDALLLGFALGACVGVDIESPRPRPHVLELARRYFTAREAEALAALPRAAQEDAFYRLWTAKEALLKATGHGLAHGLDRVEFEFIRGRLQLREPATRASQTATAAAIATTPIKTGWNLLECTPLPGYRACVAYSGSVRAIRAWRIR